MKLTFTPNKSIIKIIRKYHSVIESIDTEMNYNCDTGREAPDYWLYLKKGFWCANLESGLIHEYTTKALWENLKSVEPSDEDYGYEEHKDSTDELKYL